MDQQLRITERDLRIIEFLTNVGAATHEHVAQMLGAKPHSVYIRLHRLTEAGYLRAERPYQGFKTVYSVPAKGAHLIGDPGLETHVSVASLPHRLSVVDTYLRLREQHPSAQWDYERDLRAELARKYGKQPGGRPHVPDGVLHLEGKRIAIEVELSSKASSRLEKILQSLVRSYDETWYFVKTPRVAERIITLSAKYPTIVIHTLNGEVMSTPNSSKPATPTTPTSEAEVKQTKGDKLDQLLWDIKQRK